MTCLSCLALVGALIAGHAATSPSLPIPAPAVVWTGSPVPPIDIPFLLTRLTVPLGTVPVID